MTATAINMLEAMIAYAGDGRATCVERRFDRQPDPAEMLTIGVSDFSDDASVHADHWERHPAGDEILFVLAGRLLVTVDGQESSGPTPLGAGEALIMPRGAWHRLSVVEPGRLVVLSPRAGSQMRAVGAA